MSLLSVSYIKMFLCLSCTIFLWFVVLNVHVEAPIITSPSSGTQFTTNEETEVTFTCTATDPTVLDKVSLGNEMTSIMSSSGLMVVTRSLTLSNTAGEDSGEFVCSASVNIPGIFAGSTNSSFNLLIYRKFANIFTFPLTILSMSTWDIKVIATKWSDSAVNFLSKDLPTSLSPNE